MARTLIKGLMMAGATVVALTATVQAGPLMDRIDSGQSVRIGFANEIPWAYPGENNAPMGFVNAYALGVLETMGYDNIEPVVTEWGGLIPGLQANRFDIITGGMYILESRCENVTFSEPMAQVSDAFIVPEGNPKGIENYADVAEMGAVFVTGAGYNTVEAAAREGIPDGNVMQVPGPTEILAAVRAGRADAGGVTYFTALNLAEQAPDEIDVTDPRALPEWTRNWVGIAFRDADADFVEAFNAAQAEYLGSPEMLAAVEQYGYNESTLPDPSVSTDWVCQNR